MASYADAIGRWSLLRRTPRALIIGGNPQLYELPWPAGTDLVTIPHAQDLLDLPRPCGPSAAISNGVALPPESRDIVVCDGGLNLLSFPEGHAAFNRRLREIVAPGGIVAARVCVLLPRPETVDTVVDDLRSGRVADIVELRTRLWMAAQQSASDGVSMAAIEDVVRRMLPGLPALEIALRWPPGRLGAFDPYRDRASRYHFFTLDDIRAVYCGDRGGFTLETIRFPAHPLGSQYPTIVLRTSAVLGEE
jgi:hypothetical protein